MSRNKNKYKPQNQATPEVLPEVKQGVTPIEVIDQLLSKNDLADVIIRNGLQEAFGLNIGSGFPQNQGTGWSSQLSEPNTGFVNLRWWLISNLRQFLSQAYVEFGLVQTIVDVPVDDGLRGGIEVKSKQLSEEQIAELLVSLDRDDDITTAGQAAKWNRLFGGAGILILTDQDPEEPLELSSITKDTPLEFRAVDMWELFWDKQNSEGYDPAIQTEDFEYYNYYGEQVHKSRVMRLKGLTAPSFIRPRLRGWGFSIVEHLVRPINQFLKAQTLTFEVLDEFKIDVYKIKNLTNSLLSAQGTEQVKRRVAVANLQKNYQNAIVMDSEDEWDHKQLSFTGLAEVMKEIRMQIASDMRMPLTKLFGISAAGFNSGEDDIEVYNAMVESQVRNKLKYDLLRICEIKCQKLFGFVPDDISIAFKPLRVLSALDEETVKTQKFTRVAQAKAAGELTTLEFREACNKGNLFDITLDTDEAALGQIEDIKDEASDANTDPEKNTDIDDPGANRADTQKSRATEVGGTPKGEVKSPSLKPKTDKPEKPAAAVKNEGWEESKHPRADDGKFGKGSGSSKKAEPAENPAIKTEKLASNETYKSVIESTSLEFSQLLSSQPNLAFAASTWSGGGYIYARQVQQGKKLTDPSEIKLANQVLKEFEANFDKLPKHEGPLVRDLQIELSDAREAFKAGEELTLDAYSSFTARDRYASSRRKVRLVVEHSTKGRAMWGLSTMPEELEVIVPKDQKYKITKVEEMDEAPYIIVHLKEL